MKKRLWSPFGIALLALLLMVGLAAPGLSYAQDDERPFLGVQIENGADGALVRVVFPDSPAEAAGVQVDDLITAVDGEAVTLGTPLATRVLGHAPGDVIALAILRSGEEIGLEVTLGVAPEAIIAPPPAVPDAPDAPPSAAPGVMPGLVIEPRGYLGVSFLTLTPEIIAELDQAPAVEEGALIRDMQPETPAAEAGLLVDDVVTAVNGEPVDAERTLADRIYAYEAGDVVTLAVQRGADELTLEVTLMPQPAGMGTGPGIIIEGVPGMPFGQGPGANMPGQPGQGDLYFYGPNFFFVMPDGSMMPFMPGMFGEGEHFGPGMFGELFPEMFGEMFGEGFPFGEMEDHLDDMPFGGNGHGMGPFGMFLDEAFLETHPEFEAMLDDLLAAIGDPDFDWEAFLAEHPEFGAFMLEVSPLFGAEDWGELLPDFPWFGEYDPFHEGIDPDAPLEDGMDNAA